MIQHTLEILEMLNIRKMVGLLLLTLAVGAVATACGQDDPTATAVPTPTATSVPGATPTPTPEPPSEQELFQIECNEGDTFPGLNCQPAQRESKALSIITEPYPL